LSSIRICAEKYQQQQQQQQHNLPTYNITKHLKYRVERIRFHTHTHTHTHSCARIVAAVIPVRWGPDSGYRRRRRCHYIPSDTLASGGTGGGDGVTQGIKKKKTEWSSTDAGRVVGGDRRRWLSRNWADTSGRPVRAHTHTHTHRRTHARGPADAVVRTRRDQSSRMRTSRPANGSCSACTRPGPGPSRPARYRAPRRRCGPHAREPVRGRPPPCRVTYRAVL